MLCRKQHVLSCVVAPDCIWPKSQLCGSWEINIHIVFSLSVLTVGWRSRFQWKGGRRPRWPYCACPAVSRRKGTEAQCRASASSAAASLIMQRTELHSTVTPLCSPQNTAVPNSHPLFVPIFEKPTLCLLRVMFSNVLYSLSHIPIIPIPHNIFPLP